MKVRKLTADYLLPPLGKSHIDENADGSITVVIHNLPEAVTVNISSSSKDYHKVNVFANNCFYTVGIYSKRALQRFVDVLTENPRRVAFIIDEFKQRKGKAI